MSGIFWSSFEELRLRKHLTRSICIIAIYCKSVCKYARNLQQLFMANQRPTAFHNLNIGFVQSDCLLVFQSYANRSATLTLDFKFH